MNALKCDRCGYYYDYDPSARYNYISFGHKDVVPSKHQQTKDLCPECMDKFIDWLENPFDPETCKRNLGEDQSCLLNAIAKAWEAIEPNELEERAQKAAEDTLQRLKLCNREKCKGCEHFGWSSEVMSKPYRPGGYYTCRMFHSVVTNPCEDRQGAAMLQPKDFFDAEKQNHKNVSDALNAVEKTKEEE